MFKYFKYIIPICLLVMMTGCVVDQMVSWSPDGRYVLYSIPDEKGLWRYDTVEDKTEKIELKTLLSPVNASGSNPLDTEIPWCSYLDGKSRALICTDDGELYIVNLTNGACELIDTELGYMGIKYISGDTEKIYYVKGKESSDTKEYALMEYKNKNKTALFSLKEEFGYLDLSPDGRYLLYTTENSLNVYDLIENKTSVISNNNTEGDICWPKWVNKNEIVYLLAKDTSEEKNGESLSVTLNKISIDNRTFKPLSEPVELQKNIYPIFLRPVREYTYEVQKKNSSEKLKITEPIVVTSLKEPNTGAFQPAVISIKTGDILWKSDTLSQGVGGTLSPDGQTMAYLSDVGNFVFLETKDIKTKKQTIVWRNEAEKLFAEAEALKQAGKMRLAMDKFRSIIKEYPDSKIVIPAYSNIALLHLEPELFDLDAVYESLTKIGASEIPAAILKDLWRPEDLIAGDPSEDLIQTYGTEKALKQFGFNTDLTRDLRSVWMRMGKKYLYIRVDYGAAFDLSGLTFQDTLLLFDFDTPGFGSASISELSEWDKTADRKIMVRHWYEAAGESQYNIEIHNDKDEITHKYLVSGFSPADNPLFKHYTSGKGTSNSVVYAISTEMYGLNLYSFIKKINIQVCTFKGGIESQLKLETLRFDSSKILCDVADTFGKENTRERIMADKTENPDKPAVIKGFAGTLELK